MNHFRTPKHIVQITSKIETLFSVFAALICLCLLLPVFLFNLVSSLILCQCPLRLKKITNRKGERLTYFSFNHGLFKDALMLTLIVKGHINWVGIPVDLEKSLMAHGDHFSRLGLVSLYNLHRLTGLVKDDALALMKEQQALSMVGKLSLIGKYSLAALLYGKKSLQVERECELFNIRINNVTLEDAVSLITSDTINHIAKTACFVNVNSFNLSYKNEVLAEAINDADYVFADGAGVRIAAHRKGYRLRDNVNGTDMLPLLCQKSVQKNKRIFLLGAKPGVAMKAATNLEESNPGLQISGVQHGYFDHQNCSTLIDQINASHTDILLVAFGSPMQEIFIKRYRYQLQVNAIVAVGGLFDFFSGQIPRAPLWMRELGFEWVWRLIQEPKAKFHRYVIGNPVFLYRCFFNL